MVSILEGISVDEMDTPLKMDAIVSPKRRDLTPKPSNFLILK
jgi:hypothetical protein